MMPVEILKTVRYGDGETIFHAIVKTYRNGGVAAIDQVRTLERMVCETHYNMSWGFPNLVFGTVWR